MVDTIKVFAHPFGFLSNFWTEPDGTTVEHDFQADKTFDLTWKIKILGAPRPGNAKRLGKKCPLRPDWEDVKVEVMRGHVLRKFWDHFDLAKELVATGEATLIEGNHWHDNFWGDCWCPQCETIDGQNHLGLILMEVRALIITLDS